MADSLTDPFHKPKGEQEAGVPKNRRASEQVRRFMAKSDNYRRPFLELADKAQELYECWNRRSRSAINRADLHLPYAYQLIETEIPQQASQFMRFKPPFQIKGREPSDMDWEAPLTDFLGMQLDQMNFSPKFIAFIKSAAIKGTAVAKVPYKFQETEVVERSTQLDPLFGLPVSVKEKKLAVTYDGPAFEQLNLSDFFPDWAVKSPANIEEMRGMVHRTWKTWAELKGKEKREGSLESGYSNLDELEMSLSSKGSNAWKDPYYKSDYRANDNEDAKKKPVEIWEYWGLFDPKGNGEFKEYIITLANGDVVIRCEENFYDFKLKPFVAHVPIPWPEEFYGISELFAVRGSIKEAVALRNARLDQVNLAVNRMWVVDRTSGINARALVARPNGIVWTNDIRGIQPLPPPEVPASSYREIQELGSEIQATAGSLSGPDLSSAGRVFGRSATGASLVSNIAGSRAGVKAKLVADVFFRRLVRIMLMTNAQFVSDDQWVRVSDPNAQNPFSKLPKDAFHCNYDFEIIAGAEADPAEELQRLQLGMQFFQTAEQTQPGLIKYDAVFEDIGRALFGRRTKRYVRSDEERQQMQMQQMMMEQQAQAVGQQMQAANAQAGQVAQQPNAAGGFGNVA